MKLRFFIPQRRRRGSASTAGAVGATPVSHLFRISPPSFFPLPTGRELLLDVKGSLGKLSVPEETKVAHGDDNLSLEDFLSAACTRAGGGAGPMH